MDRTRKLLFGGIVDNTAGLHVQVDSPQVVLQGRADPPLCPVSTWVSWHTVMRLALRPSWRPLSRELQATVPITAESAHGCAVPADDDYGVPAAQPVLLTTSK